MALVSQLDADGGRYSQALSEVDISDADDIKVLANDPDGAVLVHLGSSDYLDRYKIYVAHVREWRQQFSKLESVDLRYDRQIVVNPDMPDTRKTARLSPAAARAAMAAGVKRASLTSRVPVPIPAPATVPPARAALKPAPNQPVAFTGLDLDRHVAKRLGFAKGFPDALRCANGELHRGRPSVHRFHHNPSVQGCVTIPTSRYPRD